MVLLKALLALSLVVQTTASLVAGAKALPKALKGQRPVIVHLYDPKPAEIEGYAIDDVSAACRQSGAAAVLVAPSLVKSIAAEQEAHRGSFPGPLPVIVDCALKDLTSDEAAAEETAAGAKALGASALGIRYYMGDYPEASDLEEALSSAISGAEENGLATVLLGEFGADGDEGANGAGEMAAKVGAAGGLAKEVSDEGVSLGCWDGTDGGLAKLREAGFKGIVLKDACRGDVSKGARTTSPSLAAQAITRQVKAALSKGSTKIWAGAGSTANMDGGGGGGGSMEDYFNRNTNPFQNKGFNGASS